MTQLAIPLKPRLPRANALNYQDFLRKYSNGEHVEWINGEVIQMPPIGAGHTESLHNLISILRVFVEHNKLGKLRSDPFQMKTGPDLPGRQPDLLFVANRNLKRLHALYLDGPADLAVEILSPRTRTIDRVDKFQEYEAGGVREYWIVDPIGKSVEFYRLGRNAKYQLVPTADGVYRSRVVKGFWLRTQWLWSEPPLVPIFRELGIF
jgi:Uma2 family endonuclease